MELEKTIEALNKLITINHDRIEGYQTASSETEESDLKLFFGEMSLTSQSCLNQLVDAVTVLGGSPSEHTKISGKFFRVWMDVKAALTGRNRKLILESCQFGEDQAREIYEKVLTDDLEQLGTQQQKMIIAQLSQLNLDHDKVNAMFDKIVEAEKEFK
jgi:uncharacterized protein (TIGR02284 family)